MKKATIFTLLLPIISIAQNVGIGTTTPTGPLTFNSNTGNKIVLWGDGNTDHYGIGIQGGKLQFYANQPADNIVFGYGRSLAFTERIRIINTGGDALTIKGRINLLNGTNPIDLGYGSGVWLYKPDNSGQLAFMGAQNSQNVGFFGGPTAWGFTYNALNGNVGIGNNNPNAPLAFAASLGKKITLYPGNLGDAGFGMAGNRLQIYSDNPNADVAIGYDAAGVFNERFAFKPNGAIALQGNTGSQAQVLTSNESNAATWSSIGNVLPIISSVGTLSINTNVTSGPYSGSNLVFTLTRPTKVLLFGSVRANKTCVVGPCSSSTAFYFSVDGQSWPESFSFPVTTWPVYNYDSRSYGPIVMQLNAGMHTIVFGQFLSVGAPMTFELKATAVLIEQ